MDLDQDEGEDEVRKILHDTIAQCHHLEKRLALQVCAHACTRTEYVRFRVRRYIVAACGKKRFCIIEAYLYTVTD